MLYCSALRHVSASPSLTSNSLLRTISGGGDHCLVQGTWWEVWGCKLMCVMGNLNITHGSPGNL